MPAYPFTTDVPGIRYTDGAATGSGDGLTPATAWTLSQLAAASGLAGFDIWHKGNVAVSAALSLNGVGRMSFGAFNGRVTRFIGYINTPGDLSSFEGAPVISAGGSLAANAVMLSTNQALAVANLRFEAPNTVHGALLLNATFCAAEDCYINTNSTTVANNVATIALQQHGLARGCVVIGNRVALALNNGAVGKNLYVRHYGTGTYESPNVGPTSEIRDSIVVALDSALIGDGRYDDSLFVMAPTFVLSAGGSGTSYNYINQNIVLTNRSTSFSSFGVGQGSVSHQRDNVFATVSTSVAPIQGFANSPGSLQTGNQYLAFAPLVDATNGDLRLSVLGRANRRCVETMLGLVNVPLPAGTQMDSAATLRGYLATIDGYIVPPELLFTVIPVASVSSERVLTTTTGTVTTATAGAATLTVEWEQLIASQWEEVDGAGSPPFTGVAGRSYRSKVTASKAGFDSIVAYSNPVLVPAATNVIRQTLYPVRQQAYQAPTKVKAGYVTIQPGRNYVTIGAD